MESLTDEEKRTYEIHKMFDLAENVLMNYFCHYLKDDADKLFINCEVEVNEKTSELVLQSTENENQLLSMRLKIVPCDYIPNISTEVINDSQVDELIKFIQHSVNEVFRAILHHNLTKYGSERFLLESFHLEYDPVTATFMPIYVYPQKRQIAILSDRQQALRNFYEQHKSENTWESLSEIHKNQWSSQHQHITEILNELKFDPVEAKKKEEEINNNLKTFEKIGIIFENR